MPASHEPTEKMILQAHSGFRYLVLLLGVVVIVYAAYGIVSKRPYDKTMRILAAAFTGSLDLTAVLGIATLMGGRIASQLIGHLASMVLALVIAHAVSAVMKRRAPEERTYAPHLVSAVIVLAVVAVGILSIGRPIVG